ncbi:MAG: CPBP family intramembrane metalloprotease [Bifidobacteriaceae bacterium]|jgi:membrane protease YdiL (CAAX protease family)|nr:CPBP family intramembrane metalloprotease [Bifidobacteriaceae bacterium]
MSDMAAGWASGRPAVTVTWGYLAAYVGGILLGGRLYPDLSTTGWVYLGLALAGFGLFRRDFREGLSLWARRPAASFAWTAGGLLGAAVLSTAASLVPYALGADDPPNAGRIFTLVQERGMVFAVIAAAISGPAVEEIVYRLAMIGRLSSRLPMPICVIGSSLVFAAIHLGGLGLKDLSSVLPHLAVGLVLATAYWRTRNITVPVAIHVIYNLMGLATVAASLG